VSGSIEGGFKAYETNKQRYGADYMRRIGAIGGRRGHSGGFASDTVGADGLTGKERASIAGAKGGRISRRTKAKVPCTVEKCPRFARTNGLCETHYQQLRRAQK
jgi:uncharacterized protein